MKVRIDCEGCERKVKKALDDMKGRVTAPHVLVQSVSFLGIIP
jgi:copper chaperone CopZ